MGRTSKQLINAISYMYNIHGNIYGYFVPNPQVINYSKNNVFTLFCKALVQENQIEFPLFARYTIQTKILNSINKGLNFEAGNMIIPYFSSNREYRYRTINAVFYNLARFCSNFPVGMYIGVEDANGIRYYGSNGAIFNKDMVPIFFNTVECKIVNNTVSYEKINSYIHPSVLYSDNPLEKLIITKVIPYILQNGIRVSTGDFRVKDNLRKLGNLPFTIPDFKIADITDKFFSKPVLPNVLYSDDDINDMLSQNIEDVFNALGNDN